MNTDPPSNDPFITDLLALCLERDGTKNRAHCAQLRRYWSPATRHYAYPLLGRLQALNRIPETLTAALFARHPNHSLSGMTIGEAALSLAGGSRTAPKYDALERHFRRLLGCDGSDLEEIGAHLHRLVVRLAGNRIALDNDNSIALDYNKILWNLRRWRLSSEDVKIRWACDFWQAPADLPPAQP